MFFSGSRNTDADDGRHLGGRLSRPWERRPLRTEAERPGKKIAGLRVSRRRGRKLACRGKGFRPALWELSPIMQVLQPADGSRWALGRGIHLGIGYDGWVQGKTVRTEDTDSGRDHRLNPYPARTPGWRRIPIAWCLSVTKHPISTRWISLFREHGVEIHHTRNVSFMQARRAHIGI